MSTDLIPKPKAVLAEIVHDDAGKLTERQKAEVKLLNARENRLQSQFDTLRKVGEIGVIVADIFKIREHAKLEVLRNESERETIRESSRAKIEILRARQEIQQTKGKQLSDSVAQLTIAINNPEIDADMRRQLLEIMKIVVEGITKA